MFWTRNAAHRLRKQTPGNFVIDHGRVSETRSSEWRAEKPRICQVYTKRPKRNTKGRTMLPKSGEIPAVNRPRDGRGLRGTRMNRTRQRARVRVPRVAKISGFRRAI